MILSSLVTLCLLGSQPLGPGDYYRTLRSECCCRSYMVHVPRGYDPAQPTPVVLVFHGVGGNARKMALSCNLSEKADRAGFLAVYPNGTGPRFFQTFNAGGDRRRKATRKPDDVLFVSRLLDDLATVVNVDSERVYATGISNGAMLCYRLAAELSDRITAIAPVAGTMATEAVCPKRPVPVMHFHGTADRIVPYGGPDRRTPRFLCFKSVSSTVAAWIAINGCAKEPAQTVVHNRCHDGTSVRQEIYGPGTNGAEVILFIVYGGGHTWPGKEPSSRFAGKSTKDILANDLIWDFFRRHHLHGNSEQVASPVLQEP
jgi:polyhydroxybutyrate depolymerase